MSSVLATPCRPEHPCGCPCPCSQPSAPKLGQGAPPCTFRRTSKRKRANCPAGGSSLNITGLRPEWDATRLWSGSGARNSPGTVIKATAWAHSIQIGCRRADGLVQVDRSGRTRRPAPFKVPLPALRRSRSNARDPGLGSHHPDELPRRYPGRRPGSRTARSSAWRTSRPWPLRSAPP